MPSAPFPTATDQELRDAYRLLGVDLRASELVIRFRYRELVQIHHPDKWPHGSPEQAAADVRMRDINAAYDLIEGAPLEHASQPELELELEEQPLSDYEQAYRANQQIDRLLHVDPVTLIRFLFGALVGHSLVASLHTRGIITSHLYLWMIVTCGGIGTVFASTSATATSASLIQQILYLLSGRFRPW
jgi:hypothetical protein